MNRLNANMIIKDNEPKLKLSSIIVIVIVFNIVLI